MLSNYISRKLNVSLKLKTPLIFIGLYLVSTFIIIPSIAPLFGREKIQNTENIQPTNYMTVLLNRNYVVKNLNKLLAETEQKLRGTDIEIRYLDANFPFINQFPLLPHLSHKDGKKIDLSLVYESTNGKISNRQKSISGYGVFEEPKSGESNQTETCLKNGYFQYDYPKYLTFGKINRDLKFSKRGNITLINSILENENLGKLFIEPHLKNRLELNDNRIRFHGCRAVRHDDHIHIQLK